MPASCPAAPQVLPLVSIIIPAYNRADMLGDAVRSVLEQDHRPMEIVIVDDGSTDHTPSLLQELEPIVAQHPGITWKTLHQSRTGVSAARNRGFMASSGDYVLFLDSDDWLEPGAVSALLHGLRSSKHRYAHGAGYASKGPTHRVPTRVWTQPVHIHEGERFKYTTLTTTHLYERGLVPEAGGWNTSLVRCEDWDFHCRIRMLAGHGAFVRRWIAGYRQHDRGRLSGHRDKVMRKEDELLAAEALFSWLNERGWVAAAAPALIQTYYRIFRELGLAGHAQSSSRAAARLHNLLTLAGGTPSSLAILVFFRSPRPGWVYQLCRRRGRLRIESVCGLQRPLPPPVSRVLFLSPVVPDPGGTGIQRRAAAVFLRLERTNNVDLMLVPSRFHPGADMRTAGLWGGNARILGLKIRAPGIFRRFLRYADGLPPGPHPRDLTHHHPLRLAAARPLIGHLRYQGIHAFRLSVAPVALSLHRHQKSSCWLQLDLDDIESRSHTCQARLMRETDRSEEARMLEHDARAYRHLEAACIPRFDRVLVCSETDAARVTRPGLVTGVLPNTTPLVEHPRSAGSWEGRLLFIGSLGHLPNACAARWLAREFLPHLRRLMPSPLLLTVAGPGAPVDLAGVLSSTDGVSYAGAVADSAPLFLRSDVLLVPIHAGSGTRIKILEAFAHRLPVVSTAKGIEGIPARPGEHYLPAETVQEFTDAVFTLADNPQLRLEMTAAAARFHREFHTPEALSLLDTPPQRKSGNGRWARMVRLFRSGG